MQTHTSTITLHTLSLWLCTVASLIPLRLRLWLPLPLSALFSFLLACMRSTLWVHAAFLTMCVYILCWRDHSVRLLTVTVPLPVHNQAIVKAAYKRPCRSTEMNQKKSGFQGVKRTLKSLTKSDKASGTPYIDTPYTVHSTHPHRQHHHIITAPSSAPAPATLHGIISRVQALSLQPLPTSFCVCTLMCLQSGW